MDEPSKEDPQESSATAEEENESIDPNELSKEEQMALYEESLKDSDWGHQPC